MNTSFKLALGAALLTGLMSQAQAVPDLTPNGVDTVGGYNGVSFSPLVNNFLDLSRPIDFNLTGPATSVTLTFGPDNRTYPILGNLPTPTLQSWNLEQRNGGAWTTLASFSGGAGTLTGLTLPASTVGANDYRVTLNVSRPGRALAGDFQAHVSAVPELHEWAMMLVGLGLMGVALRRRPRQDSVAA